MQRPEQLPHTAGAAFATDPAPSVAAGAVFDWGRRPTQLVVVPEAAAGRRRG